MLFRSSLEEHADRIAQDAVSWDRALNVLSYEEQAELLVPAFPREALEFAWRDYPQYLRALSRRPSSAAAVEEDEDNDEAVQAFSAPRPRSAPAPKPAPVDPVGAPWGDAADGEITPEEAAGVADIFSAAPASEPSEPAPSGDVDAVVNSMAPGDILARARAAKAKLAQKK